MLLTLDSNMNNDFCQKNSGYFKILYEYRELFYFFAWRDILVRYKQAFFGIAWALVRPILTMLVFAFLFGKVAHLPSDGINYSLFVLAGMLPWQLFSASSIDTCNSLIINPNLISKVYFPRIVIPVSQIIVNLVDFLIGLFFLLAIMPFYENIKITILALPFLILLCFILCVGTGLWLSALTIKYRDFKLIAPFFVQFGVFVSPVGYGSFIIADKWQWLYSLNPIVGIIDGFRWAFFGVSHPYFLYSITISIIISVLITITGFLYFRKMEQTFADKI